MKKIKGDLNAKIKYSMFFLILLILAVYAFLFSFDRDFLETMPQSILISSIFVFISTFIIESIRNNKTKIEDEMAFFEFATPYIRNIIHRGATFIMVLYENKNDFKITHVDVLLPVLDEINLTIELADKGFDEDFAHELRIRIYNGQYMLDHVEINQDMVKNFKFEAVNLVIVYLCIKQIRHYSELL